MKEARAQSADITKPRLFERQRQLLALVRGLGGSVGNLDFQKLLFLYSHEPYAEKLYEFVPYKFGAFSFTSYADRRKLVERGYLADDANRWRLTDLGARTADLTGIEHLREFVRSSRGLRGDALVAETYRRFPYYATRSEIAGRALRGDRRALQQIESARSAKSPRPLSTIGYEGRSLENYLNRLLRAGTTLLCDVRKNPISRKYGFSKKTLSNGCEGVGIKYRHVPELGITSDKRRNLETQADYDALFEDYENNHLPMNEASVARIREWIRSGERVTLTCYELLPEQCHRHCVADALTQAGGRKIVAKHL